MLEKGDVIELCYGEPPYNVFGVTEVYGENVQVKCLICCNYKNSIETGIYSPIDNMFYVEDTDKTLIGVEYNILERTGEQ